MAIIVKKNELFRIRFSMIDSYFVKSVIALPDNLEFDEDIFNYRIQDEIINPFEHVVNNEFNEEDRNEILGYDYLFKFKYLNLGNNYVIDYHVFPITANSEAPSEAPLKPFKQLLYTIMDDNKYYITCRIAELQKVKSVEITSILKPKSKLQTS